ncbi:MAG: 2,3-bisphosphoglycerate-independent phosphoglycerate mutase, partial [Elusimicrobia bacterium]|nr:2,3-bisphosphoglycerate-independent phosphoglycerate mutase [Elusimicrobiota bacterium]
LVEPPAIDRTLGQYLCAGGVTSFACSETQKFGHVTYFWNGNNSGYIDAKLEKYVEVPSDRVQFDQRPWMKAAEITDELLGAIASGRKFIRVNYPNGDMVGHTGNLDAVRVAVEAVDLSLARLWPALEKSKGVLLVTADHGNADLMFTVDKKGKRTPMVAHTLNPVPFIVKDFSGANRWEPAAVPAPSLSNVAATICRLLGFEPPADYDPALVRLS